jgi:hypothetical protein
MNLIEINEYSDIITATISNICLNAYALSTYSINNIQTPTPALIALLSCIGSDYYLLYYLSEVSEISLLMKA